MGDSLDNDVAGARAAGIRRDPGGARRRGARRAWRRSDRSRSSPPYSEGRCRARSSRPPPTPPELPEEASAALAVVVRAAWRSWRAPSPALITAGIAWAALGVDDPAGLALARSWRARCCWTARWSGAALLFASFVAQAARLALRAAPDALLARRRLGGARHGHLLRARGGLLGDPRARRRADAWRRTWAPTTAPSG